MKRYDWIVFDSTGTLMTPDPEPAILYHQAGRSSGSKKSIDQIRVDLKASMKRNFFGDQALLPTDASFELGRWRRIVSQTLDDLMPDQLAEAFEVLWAQFAESSHWRLFEDTLPTIRRLRSVGYKIAVASNFDERLRSVIEGFGIKHDLDEVLISSELGWSKPNLKFYDAATSRLNATDRSRLLMIGDTYLGDVDAATKAGWDARHLVRDAEDSLLMLVQDLFI